MGFTQGETVVHPHHGAAVVGRRFTKDLGQGRTDYVELHIKFGDLTILVPADSMEEVGIRSLSSREDAGEILALLTEKPDVPMEWTERNAVTTARMKSLELAQMAMVVRDLLHHQRRIEKPLNLGEKGSLDTCLGHLARELSLSLELSEDETMSLLVAQADGEHAA